MKTNAPSLGYILALLFTTIFATDGVAQSGGNFPYNPDANGNEAIETNDLIEFLTVFGSSFLPSGVLPVEGGGTGVTTADSVRLVLGMSTYADVVAVGEVGPEASITGTLNISQALSQGSGTVASGSYAQAQGRNSTASGPFSFASNQNSTATGVCSSAIGEGTSALATAAHSQGFGSVASGLASHAEG